MSQPYIGEIRMFAFGTRGAPNGWQACDGSLLPISEYDALFALIGTTYGGDGQTTFAVPDLRGRLPIHQGQGPGLSNYVMGQMAGTENVTLLTTQMPIHTHTMVATTGAATSLTPGNTLLPGSVSGQLPPCGAARSTITEPAFMACTISGVTNTGAGRPGMSAVVMTTSACATRLATSAFWRSSQLWGMGLA